MRKFSGGDFENLAGDRFRPLVFSSTFLCPSRFLVDSFVVQRGLKVEEGIIHSFTNVGKITFLQSAPSKSDFRSLSASIFIGVEMSSDT